VPEIAKVLEDGADPAEGEPGGEKSGDFLIVRVGKTADFRDGVRVRYSGP
jgi:hypothetical protein